MRECPQCGNATIEERVHIGGQGEVFIEKCSGLTCDFSEPLERLTFLKSVLRSQFEDEQGCGVWDLTSMIRLDQRWERAKEIVIGGEVQRNNGHWVVNSQSRADLSFEVRLNGILGADKHCQCEDYTKRAPWGWCKHRLAAWICSQLTEAQLKNIRRRG